MWIIVPVESKRSKDAGEKSGTIYSCYGFVRNKAFLHATMARWAHCSSSKSREHRSSHSASQSACWFRAQLAAHFPKIGSWQLEKDSRLTGSLRRRLSSKHHVYIHVCICIYMHVYACIYIYIQHINNKCNIHRHACVRTHTLPSFWKRSMHVHIHSIFKHI